MARKYLLHAIFLITTLSPLSAQGWEAIQAEKFDGSGFPVNLQGMQGFHAVGFVRGTYGSTGVPEDTCALLQPYASGSLIAMKTDLEPGFEYRLQLYTKAFGQGQKLRFSFHTAPSSGGAAAGPDVDLPSISTDDPSLPGMEATSAAFRVDAAGTYRGIAQAQGDSPSGWARYDDVVLERRPVDGCPSVAGPDVMICRGDTVQIGTGCLPEPHPLDSLEYCYRWIPEAGLDDPESAMPNATPQETTTYQVFVTTSQGELVAEDEVTVTVNTVEVRILPEDASLCYRMIPASNTRRNADTEGNRPTGISCTQDYVDLSLDGVFVTANWSNGSSGDNIVIDEPGFYSVIVTDENGCEASAQVEVGMCTATPLAITADSPQLCEDTLTLSVAEGFASYNWSDDSILPELQVIDTGTYSITVEDVNGCIGVDSFTVIACNPIVDIDVYNGFYDWVTNTTWSGGQLIPDNLELSMGAVTIANLNDTDGDTIPDFQDQIVQSSILGRNEIDLVRLAIFRPQPYSTGNLQLKILQGGDKVKLWKQPDKSDEIIPANTYEYEIDFNTSIDSVVYYIETLDHSSSIKDILIEASYENLKDTVAHSH